MSRVMSKPVFWICKKQRCRSDVQWPSSWSVSLFLLHRTCHLLPKSEISSLWPSLWLYSFACVGPGQRLRRQFFSPHGSYICYCLNIYWNTLETHHLLKWVFLCEYSLFSIGDNVIDKFIQLACIRCKNQNAVAHGCRDFVTILRQPQF